MSSTPIRLASCASVALGTAVTMMSCASVPVPRSDLWSELQAKERSSGLSIVVGGSALSVVWLDRPQHASLLIRPGGTYYDSAQVDATGQQIVAVIDNTFK